MIGPLWTLLTVIAYGSLHSILASNWAKTTANRLFGPSAERTYRVFYNLLGGLTFIPVLAVPVLFPGPTLYKLVTPWSFIFRVIQILAIITLGIGLLQTDVWSFLGLRQWVGKPQFESTGLIVQGLYRRVRHPLYTAGLAFIWFNPTMTLSLLALNIGLTIYIYVGSLFEEQRLLREFGQEYADYQQQVPRLLLRIRLTSRSE